MSEKKELKELSRSTFDASNTLEAINAGSLQRIADATEVMSQNYNALIADRDRFKKWYYEEREENDGLRKTIGSLRGWITRLKK